MAKLPVFPVHILFDSRAVDQAQLTDALCTALQQISADAISPEAVHINLINLAYCMKEPCEPHILVSRVEGDRFYLDLRSAFELVINDFQHLDALKQGFGSPEVLLLIGSESLPDWLLCWQQLVEIYRALILTYWVSDHEMGQAERSEKEKWLALISPSPTLESKRYKVEILPNHDQTTFLINVFKRLHDRIGQRLRRAGPISIEKL
jgi:hypothetical protein